MTRTKFNYLVDELWKKRKKLNNTNFDFPDYCNIPTSLSNSLSPEAVDAIQSVFSPSNKSAIKSKKIFSKELYLSIVGLGEKIK